MHEHEAPEQFGDPAVEPELPEAPAGTTADESADAGSYVEGGRRRRKKSRLPGCVAVLVLLGLLVGGGYLLVDRGIDWVSSQFNGAEDYPGPGTGSVVFEVEPGDSVTQMGRNLKAAGVVASVDGFIDAARSEQRSSSIQVGFYELAKEMRSADVVAVLVDPSNRVQNKVTVPEGVPTFELVDLLAEKTEFSKKAIRKALDDPAALGLPDYAEGNPEGYLFPATYELSPKETPASLLKRMVDRWRQAAETTGLTKAAQRLGYTEHELMTIASLVESEGRGGDMAKIARVIYNRLETEGAPTYGKLELDATVNFALGRNLGVAISQEDLEVDSPYNTRKYPGLPPGPIEAPGEEAMEAAFAPAQGPWFFYVTVNLETGETKFTEDYDEFLVFKQELSAYCDGSDAC